MLEGEQPVEDVAFELLGADIGDQAGRIVGHWDTDGDGVDELLVGAPYAGDDRGRVHIADTPLTGDVQLNHTAELLGRDAAGNFGGGLALYEGHLAVGASEDDLHEDGAGTVFLLAPTATHADDAWLTITGAKAGDHLGRAVHVADVDGDGDDDLMFGANGIDREGDLENAGATYLIPGPLTTSSERGDAPCRVLGTTRSAWMGSAVTSGDLDGDGLHEIISSAYATDWTGCEDCGLVAIAPGDLLGDALATDLPHLVGTQEWTGRSLTAPADVTGDGQADLLVGAPAADERRNDGGLVYVFDGGYDDGLTPDDAYATIHSSGPDRYVGDSLKAWDQDGDGQVGLAVGAPYRTGDGELTASGAVYVFHTVPSGVYETADADASVLGTTEFRQLGRSMDVHPDATGDGQPDLLVGMFHDPENPRRTGAFLLPGASPE